MAIKASELNVILSLQQKQFSKDLARTQRQVDRFGAKIDKQTRKAAKGFKGVGTAVKALAPILAGVFSVRAINSIVNNAAAISDLARIAGVNTTEFQKLAAAARTVGVEQDKLSDIIKDTNDKVGDFLITGQGPMVDFFETIAPLVGITADNFRGLSGPQALQLYVSSLEKANVSQSQMTFFMEAIASDATALLPLLRNNGAEFERLGEKAQDAGRILSEDALEGAENLREKMQELTGQMNTLISEALLENGDQIIRIVERFTNDILPKVLDASEKIAGFLGGGGPPGGAQISAEQRAIDKAADDAAFANMDKGDPSNTGVFTLDKNGNVVEFGNLTDDDVVDLGTVKIGGGGNVNALSNQPGGILTKKQQDDAKKTQEDAAAAIEDAKNSYQDLLNTLDPLSAATFDYVNNLENLNTFERLTGQEIANKAVLIDQLRAQMKRAKDEATGFAQVTDALEDGLTNAFMAGLEGAESFKDAMKNTAQAVVRELYRVLVVQQLVNAAMGALGFTAVPGGGFAFPGGAHGRQMQAGKAYMTGESGRELFIPSTPGRLLSPAQTMNAFGGGSGVVVNQSINVTTGVQQTVRTEIKSMMPQIAEATKGAVADAKMRGGQYKRAFN
jgi:plasmid maintenance system antidote protein VapI